MPYCIETIRQSCNYQNAEFILGNVLEMELPKADLLLAKDVLMHWTDEEVLRFIPTLKKYKWSLITNRLTRNDVDIRDKENVEKFLNKPSNTLDYCRPLDLTLPPFSIPGQLICLYYFQEKAYNGIFLFSGDNI